MFVPCSSDFVMFWIELVVDVAGCTTTTLSWSSSQMDSVEVKPIMSTTFETLVVTVRALLGTISGTGSITTTTTSNGEDGVSVTTTTRCSRDADSNTVAHEIVDVVEVTVLTPVVEMKEEVEEGRLLT